MKTELYVSYRDHGCPRNCELMISANTLFCILGEFYAPLNILEMIVAAPRTCACVALLNVIILDLLCEGSNDMLLIPFQR